MFLLYIFYLHFNPSQATNILPCERAKLVAMDLDTLVLAEVNRNREGIGDVDEIGKSLVLIAQLQLQTGLSNS